MPTVFLENIDAVLSVHKGFLILNHGFYSYVPACTFFFLINESNADFVVHEILS